MIYLKTILAFLVLQMPISYEMLEEVYHEFEELQQIQMVDGIPDYSPNAMQKQYQGLLRLQKVLINIDTTGWTIDQKIDYEWVQAQMNGLEFNHRVLKHWSREPGFYSTLGRFNPTMDGSSYIPRLPIANDNIESIKEQWRILPDILEVAKRNLTEMTTDLVTLGIETKNWEENRWIGLLPELKEVHPELVPLIEDILAAITDFKEWLKEQEVSDESSGVGIDNYNWLLKEVYLLPWDYEECLLLTQRELDRSLAMLKLEEHKNRNLPELKLIDNQEEYELWFLQRMQKIRSFVESNELIPDPENLTDKGVGSVSSSKDLNFFQHVLYRDPLPLNPHDFMGHGPDEKRQKRWRERSIPRGYDNFYVSGFRAEALATGSEDILMQLGLLEDSPRSRELCYLLRIFRAVRTLADMKMHSNELNLKEAMDFARTTVPYGWYKQLGSLIWEEMDLYMRQPGYGMGYLIGSIQLEKLLAEYARVHEQDFTIKAFFTEFLGEGMVPLSLIEWKMTGVQPRY